MAPNRLFLRQALEGEGSINSDRGGAGGCGRNSGLIFAM
jgi:hypothetical protein